MPAPVNSSRRRDQGPRGRTSLACRTCRRRKVKCSGDWPRCIACRRRADRCEYEGVHIDAHSEPNERGGDPGILSSGGGTSIEGIRGENAKYGLPSKAVVAKAVEVFLEYYGQFPFWFFRQHAFMEEVSDDKVPRCLLFCILSVIARFVEPCYELYGGSIEASAHFASLAREETAKMLDEISLLNVQCSIIMALYELGHGNEHRAWLRLGIAMRICQVLGLAFESDYSGDDSITAETKRRTFWSCYAMEKLLVNGRDRSASAPRTAVTANLPTSAADFTIGRTGPTSTLPAEPLPADTLQSFMIRIADLLSRIVEWGGAGVGGRHEDPRVPWLEDMPFSQLQRELQHWRSCLPTYLILNVENIRAHVATGEGKLFGLLHLLYMTAGVRLYRKYLPFIPPPFYDPAWEGPTDGPTLISGPEAPGFWGETARMCMQFAFDITAAVVQLSEHDLHPWLLPFSGLPLIESCSMHIFATHCKWMTCDKFVDKPAKEMLVQNLRLLVRMQEHWPIAVFWIKSLRLFYERVSLSQHALYSEDDPNLPPLWTLKQAMLHFNASNRGKEGSPSYVPQPQHDLFTLLDEELLLLPEERDGPE